MEKILVVGSGLAGATSARCLAEAGFPVTVLESRRHIGGNCFDFRDREGLFVQLHGPHVFHTSDIETWNFLTQYTEWRHYEHRVTANVNGKLLPFPINLDTLGLLYGKTFTPVAMAEFLRAEVANSNFPSPPANFRDFIVSQVGSRLYETFFHHYTEKQWGKPPEKLSVEVAKRIPLRFNHDDRYFTDPYQGIPLKGFTEMIRRMLDHPNIDVHLETDYFDQREEYPAALTVFTGELDRFFNYRFGKLEYRSLKMDFVTVNKERYQPTAVINYPGEEPWTRVTEFKHFYGQEHPKTTLCHEYPAEKGHPYYVVYTRENLAKRDLYMGEVSKLEKMGGYIFCGRLAEYRYFNMDQATASALGKIRAWLKNRKA